MHFTCLKEEWAELKVPEVLSQGRSNFAQNAPFLFYSIWRNDDTKTKAYSLIFHCYICSSPGKNSIFVQYFISMKNCQNIGV